MSNLLELKAWFILDFDFKRNQSMKKNKNFSG